MCLQVDKRFRTRQEARDYKPLIANKDIKVYKYLDVNNGKYWSPYQGFEYTQGYQYSAKITKNYRKYINWKIFCNRGLHSYIKPKYSMQCEYTQIVMYIPKDSEYYLGSLEDIVSNNLIWY